MNIYIGIDMGGTKTIVAAADKKGNILRKIRYDTPTNLKEGLILIKKNIKELAKKDKILSIGCACGGPLDYKKGIISPLHQPKWRNVPLKKIIEKEFGCNFYVDVDTNVAALGENKFGEGKKYRTFIYVVIGTGVGGSIFKEGKIYRGKDDGHPELGHQSLNCRLKKAKKDFDIKKHFCECGVSDCLEGMVSGNSIKRIYGKPAEEIDDETWEEIGYNLGQGLRNIVALYAPDAILLFGGIACGGAEKLLKPAKEVVEKHVKIIPKPLIKLSLLGYEASLKGSIALAMEGFK
jgi:predicted NBD/HSP70 family sugar kinase